MDGRIARVREIIHMKEIEIRFDLVPKPKGRPRVRCKPHPSVYTPSATVKYEKAVRAIATKAVLDQRHTLPFFGAGVERFIVIRVNFFLPIPYTICGVRLKKKEREALEKKAAPGKPDIDNLIKSLMDGLEGPLYENDQMVVEIQAMKMFSKDPRIMLIAEQTWE